MASPPAAKVRKTSSYRALLQRSKSDADRPVDLEPAETQVSQAFGEPLRLEATTSDVTGEVRREDKFKHDSQKKQEALQKLRVAREVHLPRLASLEQLAEDMTVHRCLRLSGPNANLSLSWLRRLPCALRVPGGIRGDDLTGQTKAEAVAICEQNVPHLMTDPVKALRWLCNIAGLLTWYEMEGPQNPKATRKVLSEAEKLPREAEQKVREWDESYRSLWVLLRQGLLPSFCIETDRFSITVFGEGSGAWTGPQGPQRPTTAEPVAVMWPSTREIRQLLHENYCHFQVPTDNSVPPDSHLVLAGGPSPTAQSAACGVATVSQETLAELRELHRDGEKATSVGLRELDDTSQTSALLFHGAWRVHVLLDVLRQYFLGQPNRSAPPTPPRLPRLLSPKPFINASAKTTEVVKVATESFTELRGRFFPQQLQYLFPLLRVCYHKFNCEFDKGDRRGLNAFTLLKQHRIEAVSFERVDGGAGDKWQFRIA